MCICHLCLFLGGVYSWLFPFSNWIVYFITVEFFRVLSVFQALGFVGYEVYKHVLPFCTLSLRPFHMGFWKRKVFYFDELQFSNFFLLWVKFLLSNPFLALDPKEFLLPLPLKFYYCTFYMYVHDKSFVNFGVRCETV